MCTFQTASPSSQEHNIVFSLLLCTLVLPHHHIFCPFERIKCCSAPWVGNNSKDGTGCAGCLCPLCGPSIPEISQFQRFQLLKLYQHQQRNKARSLLLAQTPWTGYSVCAQLPAGTFVPDRGLFDSLFSSSIWIGCGWGWDVCCWTRGTDYPEGSGSSVLTDTSGEERMVWQGREGECLSPWGLTQHLEFKGMQCCGHICPMGPTGEDAALGGKETVFPVSSESCLESEMCRVCT